MPSFPKPKFAYQPSVANEIQGVRAYRDNEPGRIIPGKTQGHLLIATWNIANLGEQKREAEHYKIIAEMLSWFDIAAIQEVKDNLVGLREIQKHLPASYRLLFSDAAGNNERLAYIYDSQKVHLMEKVGEVALQPSDLKNIKVTGSSMKFDGFDRTPYLAAFKSGSFEFLLVNVHLFYGSEKPIDVNRRRLETFALARWASRRAKSKYRYVDDIIMLGDFNLPKPKPGAPVYQELVSKGLYLPQHSSEISSSIASDNHYDQVAFFPGQTRDDFTGESGIFDFDGVLFRDLWNQRPKKDYLAYMRYYISDHRIMWARFKT